MSNTHCHRPPDSVAAPNYGKPPPFVSVMARRKPVVLWGASGHALVVCDALLQSGSWDVIGYVDDVNSERNGTTWGGLPVLGGSEILSGHEVGGAHYVFVAIGENRARLRCAEMAVAWGYNLPTAVHPNAVIAPGASVGKGSFVAAGAVVNPGCHICENVIINTSASVDHECHLNDGAHIGPGTRLGGRVEIGRLAWVGIGATVRDRTKIGERSIIGAGAVVVSDIPPNVIAYGVPARVIREVSE